MPSFRGGRAGHRTGSFTKDAIRNDEAAYIYKPRDTYPAMIVPKPVPPSDFEASSFQYFSILRKQIRDGPSYTVLNHPAPIQKPGELSGNYPTDSIETKTAQTISNPFENMQTYSQKYVKLRRTMPKLDDRVYIKSYFPNELHHLIDPSVKPRSSRTKQGAENRRKRIAKLGDDQNEDRVSDSDDLMEDDQDYDFNEMDDDEDGKDDYNAEQYFDNGEDDDMDDDGGGNDLE